MYILCIDTSSALAGIAIASETKIMAESVFNTERTLSARLLPEIERMLSLCLLDIKDIDLFVATVGPGSFTGVRAALATVQGLSLASFKKCIGFSSLTALAANFPFARFPVCTMIDARKSEVYAALYDCSTGFPSLLIQEQAVAPEILLDKITASSDSPVIFVGDGATLYKDMISARMRDKLILAALPQQIPRVGNLVELAVNSYQKGESCRPDQLLPTYLRASEAEYAKIERQHKAKYA